MSAEEICKEIKLYLFDMDGTLYLGNQLFDFTVELLEKLRASGKLYMFMTNNSSKSVHAYIQKLATLGITATYEDFVTSSQATAFYLKKHHPDAVLYVCGTQSLKEELMDNGFAVTEDLDAVDCIVMGFDTELTFKKLEDVSKMLCQTVEIDFEKELAVSISMEDSKIVVRKIRIPIFSIGLNERLDDSTPSIIEEKEIGVSTFHFKGDYIRYGDFFDGKDGYWYGFSSEENASGDASMYWVKISKENYSVTEGEWNLTEAYLQDVGTCMWGSGYPEKVGKACMREGYLYVPAYDWNGVYKINVNNSADVELIDFGFTSQGIPVSEPGSCERYLVLIGDMIVGGDFQILSDDRVVQTAGEQKFNYLATPLFQYKNYLFGWGGSYGVDNRSVYLLTPYLATINNLDEAVVKTTDQTMRITYTLVEE